MQINFFARHLHGTRRDHAVTFAEVEHVQYREDRSEWSTQALSIGSIGRGWAVDDGEVGHHGALVVAYCC